MFSRASSLISCSRRSCHLKHMCQPNWVRKGSLKSVAFGGFVHDGAKLTDKLIQELTNRVHLQFRARGRVFRIFFAQVRFEISTRSQLSLGMHRLNQLQRFPRALLNFRRSHQNMPHVASVSTRLRTSAASFQ